MAIDSAEKRKAVAGIPGLPFLGVTPNSAKDVEWRQEVAWGYPGIAPGLPDVVPDYVFLFDGAFVPTAMSAEMFTATEMDSETFVPTKIDTEAFDNG